MVSLYLMIFIDCFGMNGGNYLPSLSIHSQSHCLPSPSRISPRSPVSNSGSESGERYSRKVFVGGLPPDIDEGAYPMSKKLLYSHPILYLIEILQRKLMPVFVVSDLWSSTGLTKPRVNLTFLPKDTLFFCFK